MGGRGTSEGDEMRLQRAVMHIQCLVRASEDVMQVVVNCMSERLLVDKGGHLVGTITHTVYLSLFITHSLT